MLKLARNAFGDKEVFYTDGGATISWRYIKELYNVQTADVLHIGNKLKNKHIHSHNQKMKVAIAAQTLSHSVAAGIMYLRSLKLEQFENSEHTAEFILKINNMFDILNTRSKFGKQYKSPIKLDNLTELEKELHDTISYLKELKGADGTKLIDGPRKTFIVGFAVSTKSIIALAKQLLNRNHNKFEYVLTYRFSQDQLEMFFSKIRSRLGWNNNPNALQFKWALRALLQKNQISAPQTANCSVIDEDKMNQEMEHLDSKIVDYLNCSPIWRDDVLAYIGGYVVKKITTSIKCPECAVALVVEDNDNQAALPDHIYCQSSSPKSSLISYKSYGKLTTPSPSAIKVITVADRMLRQMLGKWSSLTSQAKATLQRDVLQEVKLSSFVSLQQHSCETHVFDEHFRDDHITTIIKRIMDLYAKIFLHRFGKFYSKRVVRGGKASKRPKLTRLVLFGNE